MRFFAILPIFLLSAGLCTADAAWVGYWSENAEWCNRAGEIGESTPDKYDPDGIFGLEWSCDFDEVTPIGIGQSWAVKTTCLDAGYEYTEQSIFMITASDRLLIISAEGDTVDLVRCAK